MPEAELDAIQRLRLTAARWQAILDTAQDAIICIGETGEITLFNPAAERTFGYAAEEVVGRNVRMLMPPPYREEHDQYLLRYRRTGIAQAIGRVRQVAAQRKNGEVFPIELSVSEARVGEDVFYNAIVRDVSDRERALAERDDLARRLQQRERLADIGVVTARIVHDFGNPLAGLSMTAQQILRRIDREPLQPASELRPSVERLLATMDRLTTILEDFKDFAREQHVTLQHVLLSPFLQEVLRTWEPEADIRDVKLKLDAPPELTVRLDKDKCQRVFDNLLKNALEAVDRGPGEISVVAALLTSEKVRVSIFDTGPGVPAGIDVFALFETTKSHGTGLGLAACKQIMLAHGGGIDFAAVEPHGAVFFVDLPVAGPERSRA